MTSKNYRRGTHRWVSPEETLERLSGLLPVFGVTRIANVTGLDSIGIPVVMVCRPNSRALAVSQGKGPNLGAAKASGLMESVESFHAERIQLSLKLASCTELRFTHPLVDLGRLPRPRHSRFQEDRPILWIEGVDLFTDEPRWLPFEAVHTDFRCPAPSGAGCFHQSSNGLAGGNHLMEAISHAICELVERDASALWLFSSQAERRRRRLDLQTVDDPDCRGILQLYDRAAVAAAVWETTTDVGLPSFDCLIVDRDLDPLRPLPASFGAGCHPCREIALMRALTEAAQSRLTSISGSRDDMDRPSHERAHRPDNLRALHALVIGEAGRSDFRNVPSYNCDTFEEDVQLQLEHLRQAGLKEAVCVDLTRPEFEIPVVKIVIPGLEPPHRIAGYVPGPRALARAGEGDGT